MKIIWWKEVDLNINNHNIYIWISLWNNFFNETNIKKYIEWWLKNTKKNICILIVDSIQKYNYVWQRKISLDKANKIAKNNWLSKQKIIKKILSENFFNKKIDIILWDNLFNYDYSIDLDYVFEEYNKKTDFYNDINLFVSTYIRSIWRTVKEKSIKNSAEYILREIPFLVKGFTYKNCDYTCYPYPILWVWLILEKIQNNIYPNLYKKLNIKKFAIQVIIK